MLNAVSFFVSQQLDSHSLVLIEQSLESLVVWRVVAYLTVPLRVQAELD